MEILLKLEPTIKFGNRKSQYFQNLKSRKFFGGSELFKVLGDSWTHPLLKLRLFRVFLRFGRSSGLVSIWRLFFTNVCGFLSKVFNHIYRFFCFFSGVIDPSCCGGRVKQSTYQTYTAYSAYKALYSEIKKKPNNFVSSFYCLPFYGRSVKQSWYRLMRIESQSVNLTAHAN